MARTAAARNRHGLERCTAGQRPPAVSGAKAWPYPHRTRRAHFEGYTYVPKGYMSRARKADAFSSDEEDRAAAEPGFWSWAATEAQESMVPLSRTETPWELHHGDASDTQRPSRPAMRDGLRIFRNERMNVGSRVQLLREGLPAATFTMSGATSVSGGRRRTLWVGAGRESSHVIIVACALRPSVLVVDVAQGRKLLHTRV